MIVGNTTGRISAKNHSLSSHGFKVGKAKIAVLQGRQNLEKYIETQKNYMLPMLEVNREKTRSSSKTELLSIPQTGLNNGL